LNPRVWLVRLRASPRQVQRLRGVLSDAERRRESNFAFERLRPPFVIAHAALRILLARQLGRAPSGLTFCEGPYGKPYLADRALEFNLSHSGSWALVAVDGHESLGVDIEAVEPRRVTLGLIRSVCSPRERAQFDRLTDELRVAAFFRLWTRKEAAIKALGMGMSQPLETIDVPLGPTAPPNGVTMHPDADRGVQWCLWDLAVPAGYRAALVVRQAPGTPPRPPGPVERVEITEL